PGIENVALGYPVVVDQCLSLVHVAGRGKHNSTNMLGVLYGGLAHGAGGGMDEDGLAALQSRKVYKAVVDCRKHHRERRCVGPAGHVCRESMCVMALDPRLAGKRLTI